MTSIVRHFNMSTRDVIIVMLIVIIITNLSLSLMIMERIMIMVFGTENMGIMIMVMQYTTLLYSKHSLFMPTHTHAMCLHSNFSSGS